MGKKQLIAAPKPSPKKTIRKVVPNVASMTDFTRGGRAKNRTQWDGLVHAVIMKFCDDASLYGDLFGEQALFAVHLDCDAEMDQNPLFMLPRAIAQFCDDSGRAENCFPDSYENVETEYRVQYVYSGNPVSGFLDTDKVGLKVDQMGFYVGGSMAEVKNLLILLDAVFKFRLTYEDYHMERLPRLPGVRVYVPSVETLVVQKEEDNTHCHFDVVTEVYSDASVFHLPPPLFPPRHIILTVKVVDGTVVHLMFSGNTEPFHVGFVEKKAWSSAANAKRERSTASTSAYCVTFLWPT